MKTETIPIDELVEDPANVRRHGKRNIAAIKASLARFGQQKPIVVDAKNIVRAGNGTLAAAIELGWKTLDCVRSDLAGVDLTAFAIADNRTAELAEWGDDLGGMLKQLVDDGVSIETVGFTAEEMEAFMGPSNAPLDGLDDSTPPMFEGFTVRCQIGQAESIQSRLSKFSSEDSETPLADAIERLLSASTR
jgi:ParB-like chromosome segregation protein Spo0J